MSTEHELPEPDAPEQDDDALDTGESNGYSGAEDVATLLGQVADLREEAKAEHHWDRPIPGYNELFWARYRPFPASKTERKTAELRKIMERGGPVLLQAACDTIIDACDQVMLLPPRFEGDPGAEGENLIAIDDEVPIRFEYRLAELIVKNKDELNGIKTARDVVKAIFPTEQAIIAQNIEISRWMQDVTRNVDRDSLGE